MQGDNAAGEIVIVATLETGLDHHVFQRVLVGMHANALGQVAIAWLVLLYLYRKNTFLKT